MRLVKGTSVVAAAGGLIAGLVLAVPSGASAADGQPLIMGADNSSHETTWHLEYGSPGHPCAPGSETPCELPFRYPPTALNISGGVSVDFLDTDVIRGANIEGGASVKAAKDDSAVYASNSSSRGTVTAGNSGTGSALYGAQLSKTSTGAAVIGSGNVKGRGGLFRGGAAQLRMEPGTLGTHPTAGLAGDLYLDKTVRLWLCKGGTSWKLMG